MAMNLFGTIVKIEGIEREGLLDSLLSKVVKRSDERLLLRDFLLERSMNGVVRFDELRQKVASIPVEEKAQGNMKNAAVDYYKKQLERIKTRSGIPLYRDLVLQGIEKEGRGKTKEIATRMRRGKEISNREMPSEFPSAFNKVENLVMGKLRSDVGGEEYGEYVRSKYLDSEMSRVIRDLFFAINNKLLGKEVTRFLGLMYELNKLQVELPVNELKLKLNFVEALVEGKEVNLVHVKCLRFVYPKNGGVEILTDSSDVVVDGTSGKYIPKSEVNLFPRLIKMRETVETFGLKSRFTICCSDEDLELLFPENNLYVSDQKVNVARENAQRYIDRLKKDYGGNFSFTTINEMAINTNGEYQRFRTEVLRDIVRSGRRFVNPEYFEKDRVDHQYAYYQELLGESYSRAEARRSIAEQTASVIALREVLKRIDTNAILVEENRYGENKLIANGEFPVMFIKLRDPKRSLV